MSSSIAQTLCQATSSVAWRRVSMGCNGTLSGVAIALLADQDAMAQRMSVDMSKDVGILNVALGLELGAINAYLGAIPAFGSKGLASSSLSETRSPCALRKVLTPMTGGSVSLDLPFRLAV